MRFSIKTLMVTTLVCALVLWALTPLMLMREYQARNAAMHKIMQDKGLNPQSDTSSMFVKREYDANGLVIRTTYISK